MPATQYIEHRESVRKLDEELRQVNQVLNNPELFKLTAEEEDSLWRYKFALELRLLHEQCEEIA